MVRGKAVMMFVAIAAAAAAVAMSPSVASRGGERVVFGPGFAYGEDDWRQEFDDVCSRTQDAMAMTPQELQALVDRADRLLPRIERLDETQRKVFLKRLRMCRDLYQFVLEEKSKK
jgi:hypothetical protein